MLSLSGVTFVLFLFRFRLFGFYRRPRPFVQLFLDIMHAPRQPRSTQLSNDCLCLLLFCFFVVLLEVSLFPSIMYQY